MNKQLESWQRRLLPLMSRMIVGVTIFFLLATLAQLIFLNWTQLQTPTDTRMAAVKALSSASPIDPSSAAQSAKLAAQIFLEYDAIERHFSLMNAALMARLWIKYLGFLTGMTIALIGASFILGKLSAEDSDMAAKAGGMSVTLKSASPGLFLVVVGSAIMMTTILVNHTINQNYKPMYLTTTAFFPGTPMPITEQQRRSATPKEDPLPKPLTARAPPQGTQQKPTAQKQISPVLIENNATEDN